MTMVNKSHEAHFSYQVGGATLAMLMAYREFGVTSRNFMLGEHGKVLEKIRARSGPFKGCSENELAFAEGRIYVELVERICQLVEDLSILCYALRNDLSDFPRNILRKKKQSVKQLLEELTRQDRWFTLLRYPDPKTLQLPTEDKYFLSKHYERNIHVLQNFAKVLERFRKLHWRFFIRHKHANPLIYGITNIVVGGEPAVGIPAYDDPDHPEKVKGIIMKYSMYKEQRKIANRLIEVIKDLLERTILFIEIDGRPIIEWRKAYYKMDAIDWQRLQNLIQEYNKGITRNPLEVTLKLDVPSKVIREFTNFYHTLDLSALDT